MLIKIKRSTDNWMVGGWGEAGETMALGNIVGPPALGVTWRGPSGFFPIK